MGRAERIQSGGLAVRDVRQLPGIDRFWKSSKSLVPFVFGRPHAHLGRVRDARGENVPEASRFKWLRVTVDDRPAPGMPFTAVSRLPFDSMVTADLRRGDGWSNEFTAALFPFPRSCISTRILSPLLRRAVGSTRRIADKIISYSSGSSHLQGSASAWSIIATKSRSPASA